jgi:O-acetyl-ADP-ribose deacetylase (regulator of RNase III)
MIKFISGDMFDIDADILVNTINCVGVMGCGVALAFKKKYPYMFKRYRYLCRSNQMHPGILWNYKTPDGKLIVNFPTKDHWREPSRYSYIEHGLEELRSLLKEADKDTSIALPALGCGHGGLDWDIVKEMISEQLSDLDNVNVYVFQPGDSRKLGE